MNKMKVIVLASLVALVALTGCQNPINPGKGGTLTVTMDDAVSRSILPGISMNPASYDLVGSGPNSDSFSQTVSNGSSATITSLAFGEWTVTATSKNIDGTAIGQGSGTITVLSNASVSLSITVRPYEGFGTLALNVNWPAAQVQTAQIQSTLTPASGSARDLTFTVNGTAGTASYSTSDVATGYHTLILKLLDNGHLANGAVEVVRIVKDQTTSGTLAFANVNQATGTLKVNLTPEMADPLEVNITGSAATKPTNQSLALSATVSNYSDNVTYVWYVNGDAKATGASYSFDNTWAQGYYRIDITAFSADGKRAGSTTTNVQVVEAVAGNENYTSTNIGVLVYIPTGTFNNGTADMTVSSFRMGKYEITGDQYAAVMGIADPSAFASISNNPVEQITWYDSIEFCNMLSTLEGLTPVYTIIGRAPVHGYPITFATVTANWSVNGYRLPTEAEWQFAAQGGSSTNNYTYAGSNTLDDVAWYTTNSSDSTHQVGTKTANELSLFDMSGNVWELCWDFYNTYPTTAQTDYRGPSSGTYRVIRGGGWNNYEAVSSVAFRTQAGPASAQSPVGFRVVRP